jgi:hypothetical protein
MEYIGLSIPSQVATSFPRGFKLLQRHCSRLVLVVLFMYQYSNALSSLSHLEYTMVDIDIILQRS